MPRGLTLRPSLTNAETLPTLTLRPSLTNAETLPHFFVLLRDEQQQQQQKQQQPQAIGIVMEALTCTTPGIREEVRMLKPDMATFLRKFPSKMEVYSDEGVTKVRLSAQEVEWVREQIRKGKSFACGATTHGEAAHGEAAQME